MQANSLNRQGEGRGLRTRTGRSLLLCFLIGWLGIYASTLSALADRLAIQFAIPVESAGMFLSAHAAGMFVSVLVSGAVADSLGKRRIVLFATPLVIVGLALSAFAPSLPVLLAGQFLTGMGFSPCEAIGSALLTDENPEQANRWMDISKIFFCLGAEGTPLGMLWYLTQANGIYRHVLLFIAVLVGVTAVLIALAGGNMSATQPQPQSKGSQLNLFTVLRDRRVVLCGIMVFLYLGYESVGPVYFKQYFLSRGATAITADASISVFWGAMIVLRFVGAWMEGKETVSLRWFTLMVPLGVVVGLLATSDAMRLVGMALYGAGCGSAWPMLFVLAGRAYPERSGATFAVMMLFTTAGNTLFPLLIGNWVANPQTNVILCGVLALLVSVIGGMLERYQRRLTTA